MKLTIHFAINCINISDNYIDIYTKEGLWESISHQEFCDRLLKG